MPYRLARMAIRRQPAEIALAILAVYVSLPGLLNSRLILPSVRDTLEPPWLIAYLVLMTAGGLITLFGIIRPKGIINGLLVEQCGQIALTFAFAVWVGAVFVSRGVDGFTAAAAPAVFLVATLARARQIKDDIPNMRSWLTDHPGTISRRDQHRGQADVD
jgi:hypothetical protein